MTGGRRTRVTGHLPSHLPGHLPSQLPGLGPPAWRLPQWFLPVLVVAVAVTAAAARVALLGHGSLGFLVGAGRAYSNIARLHAVGIPVRGGSGYDGQFIYRLARDPFDLNLSAAGVKLDSTFRLGRIGFPALVWLVSGAGRPALVPFALLVVNGAAIACLAALGVGVARRRGLGAGWGLLVCWPGLLFSVDFDLAEPLEVVLVVAGVVALQRRRSGWAAVALTGAVLTRETALVTVLAVFLWRLTPLLRERRPARADLAWLVPPVAFLAWQCVCFASVGRMPIADNAGSNAQLPLLGIVRAWPHWLAVARQNAPYALLHATEVALLFAVVAAALTTGWRRLRAPMASSASPGAPALPLLATGCGVVAAACFSSAVWASGSDLRMFADTYALAVLVLVGTRPRRGLLAVWSAAALVLAVAIAVYRARVI